MKIQTVKFPETPEATVDMIDEMRPLIQGGYEALGKGDSEKDLPSHALALFWWQNNADFIELLHDDGRRVGLLMCNFHFSEGLEIRTASVVTAYIEPKYRGKGYFKMMLNYLQTVYQARHIKYIDIMVAKDVGFHFGTHTHNLYRMEL